MQCSFDFTGPRWLQNMKWKQVADYLEQGGDTIILPCGQTEQHGPHLPMGTDTYAAMAMADSLAERVDALIAPPIWVGWAPRMQAFPGSMTLRASTLEKLLIDCLEVLAYQGFKRIYVLNGHRRENLPPIEIACAKVRYKTNAWIAILDPSSVGMQAQGALRNGNANLLSHAAGIETANMLYVVPELVHEDLFEDTPEEKQLNVDQYVMKDKALLYDTPAEFRQLRGEKGVRGTVTWGTAERGKSYHEAVVTGMEAFIREHSNRPAELNTNACIV